MTQDHTLTVGACFAAVSASIPDWMLSAGERLLFTALTAVVGGFCYRVGIMVFDKLKKGSAE